MHCLFQTLLMVKSQFLDGQLRNQRGKTAASANRDFCGKKSRRPWNGTRSGAPDRARDQRRRDRRPRLAFPRRGSRLRRALSRPRMRARLVSMVILGCFIFQFNVFCPEHHVLKWIKMRVSVLEKFITHTTENDFPLDFYARVADFFVWFQRPIRRWAWDHLEASPLCDSG